MAKRAQIEEIRPVLTEIDEDITAVEQMLNSVDRKAEQATAVVESGLEKVADVVPEVLDATVHITTGGTRRFVGAFRNPKVLALTITLAGAAAGAGLGVAGYFLMKKRLEQQFEERLNQELDEMRLFYARRNKEGAYATPETAAEALGVQEAAKAHKSYDTLNNGGISEDQIAELRERMKRGGPATDEPDVEVEVRTNIFTEHSIAEFDLEQERSKRTSNPDVPYVISKDEYFEGEPSYVNTTITWFEGDGILADERDVPIENVNELIGEDNLLRFGYGSGDVNIVYVRNDKNKVDFEVVRSTGNYGEEVAGFGGTDIERGRKDSGD